MKVELLDRQRWHTRVKLVNETFEYLEIFHNASGDSPPLRITPV